MPARAAWIVGADRWSEVRWQDLESQLALAPENTKNRSGSRATSGTGQTRSSGHTPGDLERLYDEIEAQLATTDDIQTQLDALKAQRASGVARVSYDGKSHRIQRRFGK